MNITPSLTWSRVTDIRFLKGSGAMVEGPIGSMALIRGVAEETIPGGLLSGMHRLAAQMEAYARARAPWQNRTGKARAGLYGYADQPEDDTFIAGIAHGNEVDYALYLETRWNGRYAIIGPTQAAFASKAGDVIADEVALELRGRGSIFRHRSSGKFAA